MRINNRFVLRQLGDNTYIIETNNSGERFNKIVTFNSSAAYIWDVFYDEEFSLDEITECIVNKYGIDKDKAKHDAMELIEKWKVAGLIN